METNLKPYGHQGTVSIPILAQHRSENRGTLQLKVSDLDLEADPLRAYIHPEYTKGCYGGRVVFMTHEIRDAIKEWLKVKEIPYLEDEEGKLRPRKKRTPKMIFNPQKGYIGYDKQEYDPERVWDINESTARQILVDALKKSLLAERDPNTGRYRIHIHLHENTLEVTVDWMMLWFMPQWDMKVT